MAHYYWYFLRHNPNQTPLRPKIVLAPLRNGIYHRPHAYALGARSSR